MIRTDHRAVVFTPTPRLTVTVEAGAAGDEIHLHAGGQGAWQARMLVELGIETAVHAPFAGETGAVIRSLLEGGSVRVGSRLGAGTNGAYLHDRRTGARDELARMAATALSRHELDDLYGALVVDARAADVVLVGGPDEPGVVDPELYERLARDLVATGTPVVADLSAPELDAVAPAGLTLLKVSDDELVADGRCASRDAADVADALRALAPGTGVVVATRAHLPSLALLDGDLWSLRAPRFIAVDPAGGGDSFTAACAASLARGAEPLDALRTGAAAGALNVTRRGLASGDADAIATLADQVEVAPALDLAALDDEEVRA